MKYASIGLVVTILFAPWVEAAKTKNENVSGLELKEKHKRGRPFDTFNSGRVKKFIGNVFDDSYKIWDNFISYDSMKILTVTLPFYLIGRRADAAVHRQFYDIETHKNKNQPPKFLCDISLEDRYLAIPFISLGLVGWLSHDPYERRRGQVFSTGLMWAFAIKNILKLIKTDANLRPWHENFDAHKRSHGGNPSGHMAVTAYMATYWSLEKGKKLGIPLWLFSAFAFSMNVACNHHYFSQAVAGTGLGLMLGMAAHAAFKNIVIFPNVTVGLGADSRGNLGVRFAYDF